MSQDTQTTPGLPAVITGAMPPDRVRQFWMNLRKSWLEAVDAIEREVGISPTTAEIRAMWRQQQRGMDNGRKSGV